MLSALCTPENARWQEWCCRREENEGLKAAELVKFTGGLYRLQKGHGQRGHGQRSAVLRPLVLASDGGLLLRGEVVDDVEGLSDLLGRLPPDHLSDNLASGVEQGLDVEVVGR